jgi:O-antigen/teichoic acid export membrane protein
LGFGVEKRSRMMEETPARPVARSSDATPAAGARAMWSALDAAATPGFTLVTLAILVRALSPSDYGLLVMALAASGLSMAINPAIAATTTKFVSEMSAQRKSGSGTIAGVITTSLIAVAAIDLVILLGTVIFSEPLSRWVFGAGAASSRSVGPVLLLAMLSVAIQQIDAVLAAAIRGLERFRRQALIEVTSRGILTAVLIWVAWRTRSVPLVLIAQSVVYLVSVLARSVALRGLLPAKRLFERAHGAGVARMMRYGGWMWLTALAGVAYASADRIIIGRSLGLAAAGQYNVYLQITQVIHFIPSSVFAFSLPAFSRLAANGHDGVGGEIRRAYDGYLWIISVSAAVFAAAMMMFWPFLLGVFAGSGFAGDRLGAPALLTINFLLLACNVAPYYLLIAMGHARVVSMITATSMLAALVLMVVLIPRFGMVGAALARLAYGAGGLLLLWEARRMLKPK